MGSENRRPLAIDQLCGSIPTGRDSRTRRFQTGKGREICQALEFRAQRVKLQGPAILAWMRDLVCCRTAPENGWRQSVGGGRNGMAEIWLGAGLADRGWI